MGYQTPLIPPPPVAAKHEPPPNEVWSRQSDETDAEWEAFEEYLEAPVPRSIYIPGKATGPRSALARKHRWVERATAFDQWKRDIYDQEIEARLRTTARERSARHLAFLDDAVELVAIEIRRFLKAAREGDFNTMRPIDVVRFTDLVVKYQRLIQGETTANTQVTAKTEADLSKLTLDEVRQLEEMLERMGDGEETGGTPTMQ